MVFFINILITVNEGVSATSGISEWCSEGAILQAQWPIGVIGYAGL